jgi:hypothetical protein
VIVGYALSWYAHSWYSHGIDAEVVARNRERHQEERLEEIMTKMLDAQWFHGMCLSTAYVRYPLT